MRIIFIFFISISSFINAQYISPVWSPDQGDGTYKNPIIFADYSDPDVTRVGDDYYMTASSFNAVPGLPILHSKDLVNWKIINYALTNLELEGAPKDFFDKPQHGKGVWAPSIRYHNNEFMIYWGDPDFGIYVVKTKDIWGKWDKPILVLPGKGRIDPSPLFDDDGKVYLTHAWAGSRARLNSIMTICEMNADGTKVIGEESLIFDGNDGINHTVEGGKFYKKDGCYYLLAPAGSVEMGWQLALRSKNIYGPYESITVLAQGDTDINGPHQGGLVNTKSDEWWFIHFQDREEFGRITHLQPVKWKDNWPIMGINDKNYCGEPVKSYKKPKVGKSYSIENPIESDEFNSHKLGLQWQWHANPQQAWAFPTADGFLRMYGQYYPKDYRNFWDIPNLLLQKLPAPSFTATTKISAVLLNSGDKTGLIMMGHDYAHISLVKKGDNYILEYAICKNAEERTKEKIVEKVTLKNLKINKKFNYKTAIDDAEIYLRVKVDNGLCTFLYSQDGETFTPLSHQFQAKQGKWIGAKMGLFIMNKKENTSRSWADVDWFRITSN